MSGWTVTDRPRLLNKGCTTTWWALNGSGFAASAITLGIAFGSLPLYPAALVAAVGYGHAAWRTGLVVAHNGWCRGWWWCDTHHRCDDGPGDDEDDPHPHPDCPDDQLAAEVEQWLRTHSTHTTTV
ncbi:hypothetical protein QNO07_09405 [Streptomyces sp. 549]|uniref:hypothetical protein n=1 Tax=Streptomyces sp. 549 TaxID=3049076 RepID=UPI0024C32E7E|nr:hypothetical protein [Streptomyces sp. 549]MDK1473635.1 hypothetical protein [Streptomyces sp. 549]